MEKCRVSQEELLHDIKQYRAAMADRYTAHEKRLEVCALAKLFVHQQAAIKTNIGLPYTYDDLMNDVFRHELSLPAFKALAIGVTQPMQDLITRCARYACAVHLFGESRADELGFVK